MSPSFVFFSHDGYGLGHARRNTLIARAILAAQPSARIRLVTGVAMVPGWLRHPGIDVVRVPPMLKDSRRGYVACNMPFEEAVNLRAHAFEATVSQAAPDVVVVDRHPFGTAGELRPGLELARRMGARLALGLRDVLDEPAVVRGEMAGRGWDGVGDLFSDVLVYGARHFCDHEAEYGLALRPHYTGWVTAPAPAPSALDPGHLSVAAGGGGDGEAVYRLAMAALEHRAGWRATIAVGPYADVGGLQALLSRSSAAGRVTAVGGLDDCTALFARCAATLQMAGYNSTFEALAARKRPLLVPRHRPREEQTIRARRLALLDLADVVEEHTDPVALDPLLGRFRVLHPEKVARAGIDLSGAARAATRLLALAGSGDRVRSLPGGRLA